MTGAPPFGAGLDARRGGGPWVWWWIVWMLAWWPRGGHAAVLEHVQVLSEDGHARLVLQLDLAPATTEARATPSVGSVPARDVVLLSGTRAGAELATRVQVQEDGLREIRIDTVGTSLQLTVDLDEPRSVRATSLSPGLIVVDLLREGRAPSTRLPSDAQLLASLEGAARRRPLVVVDAGHGGWDHGAIGLSGTREADVALQIARKVAAGLQGSGVCEVWLTRSTDVFVPLEERARMANGRGATLFVSIHANAAPGPTAWGLETYSLDTASDEGAVRVAARENALLREGAVAQELQGRLVVEGTNRLSAELARSVQSRMVAELRPLYGDDAIRDLGTKTALFYVLAATRMPSVLIETSFLTAEADERHVRAAHFQDAEARAIVAAVTDWLERAG